MSSLRFLLVVLGVVAAFVILAVVAPSAVPSHTDLQSFLQTVKDNAPVATLIVTIALAIIGYIVTYFANVLLARRKDRLELVNKRLNEFYGPLYIATVAGDTAYKALLRKFKRKDRFFEDGREPPPEELEEWYLWARTVFTPLNDLREKIIIEKAYLILEEKVPSCLIDFVTHVVAYKPVMEKWEKKDDHTEKYSLIEFPEDLEEYVTRSYTKLKHEQRRLLRTTF